MYVRIVRLGRATRYRRVARIHVWKVWFDSCHDRSIAFGPDMFLNDRVPLNQTRRHVGLALHYLCIGQSGNGTVYRVTLPLYSKIVFSGEL